MAVGGGGMEEENRVSNKNYWVSNLFPAKFSSKDFLLKGSDDERKSKLNLASDFYSKIYSKVVLEERNREQQKKKKRELETKLIVIRQDQHQEENRKTCIEEHTYTDVSAESLIHQPVTKETSKMMWNKQEMEIFKLSYDELRERTLWLLCILENRNLKITDLKDKVNLLQNSNMLFEDKVHKLSKENSQLKSFASTHQNINLDLEEQLQFFEDSNNNLKSKILELTKEMVEKNKTNTRQINTFREYQMQSEKTIKNHEEDQEEKLMALHTDYERQIYQLKKGVVELEISLAKKEKECNICKRSMKVLEKHFQETLTGGDNSVLQREVKIDSSLPYIVNFMNVTDI